MKLAAPALASRVAPRLAFGLSLLALPSLPTPGGSPSNPGASPRQDEEAAAGTPPLLDALLPPSADSSLEDLTDLVGDWAPGETGEDAAAAGFPIVFRYEWGPRRGLLRIFEGVSEDPANPPILEGTLARDPVDGALRFLAVNTPAGLLFRGRYLVHEDGAVERVYHVHYPAAPAAIPEPDLPGRVRTYRELYRFREDDPSVIDARLWIRREGAWSPWGPNGGQYAMRLAD